MAVNMSHCKYHNTAMAMQECLQELVVVDDPIAFVRGLSAGERKGLRRLLCLARDLVGEDEDTGLTQELKAAGAYP